MASYFDQFSIVSIVPSITNSSFMLLVAIFSGILLFKGNALIPNRWQVFVEVLYDH